MKLTSANFLKWGKKYPVAIGRKKDKLGNQSKVYESTFRKDLTPLKKDISEMNKPRQGTQKRIANLRGH